MADDDAALQHEEDEVLVVRYFHEEEVRAGRAHGVAGFAQSAGQPRDLERIVLARAAFERFVARAPERRLLREAADAPFGLARLYLFDGGEVVYLRQRAQPHDVGQNFRRARKLLRPDEVAVGLVDYEKRLGVALRRGVELRAGNQRAGRVAGVAEPDGGSARALGLRERKYVPRPRAVAVERFFVFAVDGLEDEIFARRRVGRDYVDGLVGAARNQYVLRGRAELARERLAQREAVAVGVVFERCAQVGDEARSLRHGVGVGAEVVNFRGRREARGGVEFFGVRPVCAEFHYFSTLSRKSGRRISRPRC